jgi:quercetin dioxygenase-like cupin family protein
MMSKLEDIQHINWDDIEREELAEGLARQMMTGEKAMVAKLFISKNAVVPKHHHFNEQVTLVISGSLKFRHGENLEVERIVNTGDIIVSPENVPHEVTGLEDSVAIDIFAPPRQDWLDGTDDYFRK